MVVTDLESFNATEQAVKTSEKDINHKPKEVSKPQSSQAPQVEVNKNEEEVQRFVPADFTIPAIYYSVDNKLIDAYYAQRMDVFSEDEKDLLQEDELLHYLRQVNKDLEYLIDLKFTQFWGFVSKTPEISRFLDEFLLTVRKHNDIFKLQNISQYEDSTTSEGPLKSTMNRLLKLVLQIFFRLSLTIEGDDEYFSLQFYQKIIYDNWIFDMAKLLDIAAVYGRSNRNTVSKII